MKKILCLALVCLMMLAVVACNNDTDKPGDETTPSAEETTPAVVELPYKNALELADKIWNSVPEDKKFAGGTMAIELGAEGSDYTLTDLGLPADLIAKIDDAAMLRHMMMVNQFSAGIFHFKTAEDAEASVAAIKSAIVAKEWMCGFPEKVVVITLPGNYVMSIYGLGGLDPDPNFAVDNITPVIDAAKALVDGVVVAVDEPLM